MRKVLAGALLALLTTTAKAQDAAPRAEVPIREVILSDGARRYTIPIKVGATAIEAGMDTGSSGLRVLPGVLQADDARRSGGEDTYAYGSGAELDGSVGRGVVTIGSLSATTTLQMVSRVGCTSQKPQCPASRIPQSQYGVQGDGLPGEGFKAIIGVNMAEAEVATPLRAVGARRWIVDLPRPGETMPGRLVLNPTDAEVQGYVMLPILSAFSDRRGGLHDAVAGCVVNLANHQKSCGALMLDSGAPGIELSNGTLGRQAWADKIPAMLVFADGKGQARAAERLTIGERSQASRLTFDEGAQQGTVIFAGISPYFAFSVLYDPARGLIGLKPRDVAPGGPTGQLVAP